MSPNNTKIGLYHAANTIESWLVSYHWATWNKDSNNSRVLLYGIIPSCMSLYKVWHGSILSMICCCNKIALVGVVYQIYFRHSQKPFWCVNMNP